jgi:hypothetical protein
MERPVLEFEGRLYRRHRERWLDGHLSVPLTLLQKLDSKAKEDPAFWDHCQQQDLDDDPRTRGGVLLPPELAAELGLGGPPDPDQQPEPILGYQSAGTVRGPHRKYGLQSEFKRDGRLVLTCDIQKGWRETERSWCFRASDTSPLPAEFEIRVTVAITEDTIGPVRRRYAKLCDSIEPPEAFGNIDSVAPRFSRTERVARAITFALDENRCTVTIGPLGSNGVWNDQLPWSDRSRLKFEWAEAGLYERPVHLSGEQAGLARPFRVSLDARIHDRSLPSDG